VGSRPRRRQTGCARRAAGARPGRGAERRPAVRGGPLLDLRRGGGCGRQRRRRPPPLRIGGRAVGALMSQAPGRRWHQAMLLGLALLALARPAASQEDQAPPVAPPSPPPRELTTGHPLASRSAVLDSAQRIAAAGDTLRAAAIRA